MIKTPRGARASRTLGLMNGLAFVCVISAALASAADAAQIPRTGMEIQVLDETHPSPATIKDWQRTGAIYHVAAPKPGHNKPIGEWNTLTLTAEGSRLTVRLNGADVVSDRLDSHPDL